MLASRHAALRSFLPESLGKPHICEWHTLLGPRGVSTLPGRGEPCTPGQVCGEGARHKQAHTRAGTQEANRA